MAFRSTEPIVLKVDGGERGIDAFLAFGPDGRPGAAVRPESTGDRYGSRTAPSVIVSVMSGNGTAYSGVVSSVTQDR